MVIGNFTPDDVPWMHIGIEGVIKAGTVSEFDDARGNFILTKHARRGLVRMEYGCDEEQKKEESMARFVAFWEGQITSHNQYNEEQREKGQRYARPTKELSDHAALLEIELLRPWTVASHKSDKEVSGLKEENKKLRDALDDMQEKMASLIELVSGKEKASKEQAEKMIGSNRKRYVSQQAGTFKGWVKNNWDDIQKMPEVNRLEIEDKYTELYGEEFPKEPPAKE